MPGRNLTPPNRRVSMFGVTTFRTPQIVLFSGDVERAADFYQAAGFTEVFRTPAEGTPVHVDLELDDYRIGLASEESTRNDHGLEPVVAGQPPL